MGIKNINDYNRFINPELKPKEAPKRRNLRKNLKNQQIQETINKFKEGNNGILRNAEI